MSYKNASRCLFRSDACGSMRECENAKMQPEGIPFPKAGKIVGFSPAKQKFCLQRRSGSSQNPHKAGPASLNRKE